RQYMDFSRSHLASAAPDVLLFSSNFFIAEIISVFGWLFNESHNNLTDGCILSKGLLKSVDHFADCAPSWLNNGNENNNKMIKQYPFSLFIVLKISEIFY